MSAESCTHSKLILPVLVRTNSSKERIQIDFDDGSSFDMFGNRARGVEPPGYWEKYWSPEHVPVDPPYQPNISDRLLTAEDIERGRHEHVMLLLGKVVRYF